METVQVHSWSQSTDVHLWLCRVQHAPEERHPLPHEMRKLADADVFYIVNELNNLEPHATFTDEKTRRSSSIVGCATSLLRRAA